MGRPTTDHPHGFDTLERDACLELLASAWLGRVGMSIGALPAILPVSYVLVDETIAFRSIAGSKLETIGRGEVVCFEVDHVDRAAGLAWSVLVVGRARTERDPVRQAILDARATDLWPTVETAAWVCLDTHMMSGRRLAPIARESAVALG